MEEDIVAVPVKRERESLFASKINSGFTNEVEQDDLIVTIPTMTAKGMASNAKVVIMDPPFNIPRMRLKMVWSPLLQHDPGHKWLRQMIKAVSEEMLK